MRLASVATACCLVAAMAACASSARTSQAACKLAGATKVVVGSKAVVFAKPASGDRRYFGCAYSSGRLVSLGHARCLSRLPGQGVSHIRLAGAFVGFGTMQCGVDTTTAGVRVVDLAKRKTTVDVAATSPPNRPESFESVDALVLRGDGAVAWIGSISSVVGGGGPRYEVRERGRLLDRGAAIDPRSLAIRGSAIRWRNGGRLKSAPLAR